MPSRADLGVAREAMWEVAQYYALRDDVKLQARAAAIARVLEWVEELNALPRHYVATTPIYYCTAA